MKSMKKLVLAALILLASVVGLLSMAGCKNDSVPEVPKYTVTFDKNAEDATGEMAPQTFTQGEKKELTANAFVRPTWTFSGWSEKKDATTPEYKDKAEFTTSKDTTLYAIWTDNGIVSPVAFDPLSTKFYYGETVTVTLSTTTEGARIHYQLGEGEWKIYEKPFTVSSETVVTAYATKDGLKDSEKTKSNYLRQLISITVTPPTRTVYSEGESFDNTVVLTATYDDGEERTVEGIITSETSSLTKSAGINKEVTVSYTEGNNAETATFTVDVASYQFTETVQDYESAGKTGTASATSTPAVEKPLYKKFGDWPQTIMGAGVTVGSGTLVRGGLSYHVGSDGNYYVKVTANPYVEGYTYSDNSGVTEGSEVYFKVEPIIWRVLNSKDGKYNESENPLLLAENILTGGIKWADSRNNYMESNIRKWLNGNSDSGEQSDYNGAAGFLQTAFTSEAQKLITPTTVDNSARSTNPDSNGEEWNSGENQYASETKTKDKIFLLSMQEATMSDYGFGVYDASGQGNTRIRVTTDYAKATGAYQSATAGYGDWWWLRSPYCFNDENLARDIDIDGIAYSSDSVSFAYVGVVPALSISINGN